MTTQSIQAVFLDDGGVINDNSLRAPEWQRLVAEFFTPRLGGEPAAWSQANIDVLNETLVAHMMNGPEHGPVMDWWRTYALRWLRGMAELVGVAAPDGDEECTALAYEAEVFVTNRVKAGFPGAKDAVARMSRTGLKLYTASGGASWQLDGYLNGLGVREHFTEVYGFDLVDRAKYGPMDGAVFYERIFSHSGIDPRNALVVDDSALSLSWAKRAGAMTCLVSPPGPEENEADLVVTALTELSDLLGR